MKVTIDIVPINDKQETYFEARQLFHRDCCGKEMTKVRNPATENYQLQCRCGLIIDIPAQSEAFSLFASTAIDECRRQLPIDSFFCDWDTSIEIASPKAI